MSGEPDLYKTLQVDEEAEFEVIQAAYRRLAQKYHPDAGGDGEAAQKMAALNAAWEVLQDPTRRAAYDAARGRSPRPTTAPSVTTDPPWPASDLRRAASARAETPRAETARAETPRAETASPHWTTGRNATGSGYDPARMGRAQGTGAAGPPPGTPSGSVLNFGRYDGWSLGEVARKDIEYIEWLDRMPIGRQYQQELDVLLRAAGRRRSEDQDEGRRGLYRRR